MTVTEIRQTALKLPPRERQELVEILWASLEKTPPPLPKWQQNLIDERLQQLEEQPEEGTPFAESLERIWTEQR